MEPGGGILKGRQDVHVIHMAVDGFIGNTNLEIAVLPLDVGMVFALSEDPEARGGASLGEKICRRIYSGALWATDHPGNFIDNFHSLLLLGGGEFLDNIPHRTKI